MPDSGPPTVWVGLGTKVNIGNYENVSVDIGLSNVPVDITDEELTNRILQANMTIDKMINGLGEELNRRISDLKGV